VHAGVGPARAYQLDGVAQRPFEGADQLAADGPDARLGREPVVTDAQVGDIQADPDGRAFEDRGRW